MRPPGATGSPRHLEGRARRLGADGHRGGGAQALTVALLAGTAEARAVARALAAEGARAVASLAGVTREPAPLAVPTRRGGFGGEAPFAGWLRETEATALLDATHPFAGVMPERAARVARALGLPHRRLLRPGWTARPGDLWTRIAREEEAAAVIPEGATVFLATGPGSVARFSNLRAHLICRRIDPPCEPFPLGGRWLVGRPPFTVEGETALLRGLAIDWLVSRDAGGEGSRPKLDAARALGLPVALIDRPPPPDCARVATPEEAVEWIRSLRSA